MLIHGPGQGDLDWREILNPKTKPLYGLIICRPCAPLPGRRSCAVKHFVPQDKTLKQAEFAFACLGLNMGPRAGLGGWGDRAIWTGVTSGVPSKVFTY